VQVIGIAHIQWLVAMVPYKLEKHCVEEKYYYLVERPGLDVARIGGSEENVA
jgi:hypothetical protein